VQDVKSEPKPAKKESHPAPAPTVSSSDLVADVYRDPKGATIPYRYFAPSRLPKQAKVPLVLFLHGLGEAGTDNRHLERRPECLVFVQPEVQAKTPCFFVAPQHPPGQYWIDGAFDQTSPAMRAAMAIVDRLIEAHGTIDRDRLYVTGLSSGGIGAWEAIAKFPYKFAGAVPISACWDPRMLKHKQGVSVWAFYNQGDGDFLRTHCDEMLQAVVQLGGVALRTAYPGGGHDAWTRAYQEPRLIPWLFAQRRYRPL
jgi:predicted peptidase